MKKILYTTLLLAFIAVLTQCEKESANSKKQLSYLTNTTGGCNGEDNLKSIFNTENSDTVIISLNESNQLKMFVGLNYICCAPFTSEISVENNQIQIEITDTSTDNNYCRCMCFYTWDFLFENYSEENYQYKIILHDPQQEYPVVFREGEVKISK